MRDSQFNALERQWENMMDSYLDDDEEYFEDEQEPEEPEVDEVAEFGGMEI